jgi:hypothetical protein
MKLDFTPRPKLTLDFTPRVYLKDKTHTYLFLREKKGKGYFLTLESGVVEVVRIPLEEGEYRIWERNEGQFDKSVLTFYYSLVPLNYDFMKAIRTYWNSTIEKSVSADRELRALLGLGSATVEPRDGGLTKSSENSGISLADLCIELNLEGGQARKILRAAGIQKPGNRWEWTVPSAIDEIRETLLAATKPS